MKCESLQQGRNVVRTSAFTLVEVLVASAILATGLAGILLICANGLKTARVLGRAHVDAGSLATMLSLSNQLEEVNGAGDFGDENPGYRWTSQIQETGTNGLFQVQFEVFSASDLKGSESQMTILLFRPSSVQRVGR